MLEKLDLLIRFWELRARDEVLGEELTDWERGELLSLLRLLSDDEGMSDPGPAPYAPAFLPVQMTTRSGFLTGDLREIAPDQLIVAAADTLFEEDRTLLYLADAWTGIDYTLPCVVLWTHTDTPCAMGLAIDGVPMRSSFTVPVSGMFRSPLGSPSPTRAIG